jgi:RNA polymerase sigma-70 factor (ECF subfamily)
VRHPIPDALGTHGAFLDPGASPLEEVIGREAMDRYEMALQRLDPQEREAVIARVEMQQSYQQIAVALGKSSPDAARMTVTRALVRLAEEMDVEK